MSSIDRPLSGEVLFFQLEEEQTRVNNPALLERHGRNARTLLMEGPLRVTLVMVGAGGHIAAHRADGIITVHVLRGDIEFRVAGQEHRLAAGGLLVVAAGLEHDVASDAGGTFLLTVVQGGMAREEGE
ncbi:MAG: cupin domain-containing protein [Gemmatimonadaceae bacterium]